MRSKLFVSTTGHLAPWPPSTITRFIWFVFVTAMGKSTIIRLSSRFVQKSRHQFTAGLQQQRCMVCRCSDADIGLYIYVVNTSLIRYSKNSENFRFAKTNAKQRKTQKKSDRSVLSSPLGQDLVRCTNDDLTRLTRGGQEIVETTCENSYIHFKLAVLGQSCPHL